MRDHRKLKAFELADELALAVYRATARFPREEMFGLASQMRRAAVSTPSNIVEGSARESATEYARFLEIAYASSMELQYQTTLAERLGYLDSQTFDALHDHCVQTSKALNGLVRAVRR